LQYSRRHLPVKIPAQNGSERTPACLTVSGMRAFIVQLQSCRTGKSGAAAIFSGSTTQFGKKSQAGFLFQFKVPKMEEYCMYFPFSELRKWSKKTAETRRRNCAVLP